MDTNSFWPLFIPIFLASLAAFVIGFMWYSPTFGFGKPWMRFSRIAPEAMERGKKRMPIVMAVGFLAALWTAWVLSYVLQAFGAFDWLSAADVGLWMWAGFVAPILLGSVLWEKKSFKLYLINAFYWLVAIIAMSVIISYASAASSYLSY